MNIIICDDRQEYRQDMKAHVELYMSEKGIEFEIHQFESAESALKEPRNYDIAFLDVEMHELSGIDLAKELKKINPKIIIFFVTAHNSYLDDALDLNVLRYLNKPIDSQRLYKGLDKAVELINDTAVSFYLKSDDTDTLVRVPINAIICIEIENRKTKVVTDSHTYYSKEKLSFWKENLVQSYFYQVHSSFIVNMNYITKYSSEELVLCNKHSVPISQRNRKDFKHAFLSYIESR